METLEEIEHRPVLVLTKPGREMNRVVGRDANEVLIKSSMVDRAEAEAVSHDWLSMLLYVTDDVRSIYKAKFLEPTDRTLAVIGRDDPATKTRLVKTNARLANGIATLERIIDRNRRRVVNRAD